MEQQNVRSSRVFSALALTTAILTVGLIVFGAVVRVTDSGLGCGNHWPLCNGTIFPPLDNLTAWIEWLHRLFAAALGIFTVATLITAVRVYRKNSLIMGGAVLALVLFIVQSGLGALTVILDLPPTTVTLHLGTAMIFLGVLLFLAVASRFNVREIYKRDNFTLLAYITAALALVIILTGALVRGSGATLACIDWPLCNGEVVPFAQGQLQTIHMMHRYAVVGLGVTLVLLMWQAFQSGRRGLVRLCSILAFVAYLMQAGIGAMYVISVAGPFWGAAHVGFAATTWALLVLVCILEMLNTGQILQTQHDDKSVTWQPQSGPISN